MSDIPLLGDVPILGQQPENHMSFVDVVHRFASVGNVGPAVVLVAAAFEELLLQLFDAAEIDDIANRINANFISYITIPQEDDAK